MSFEDAASPASGRSSATDGSYGTGPSVAQVSTPFIIEPTEPDPSLSRSIWLDERGHPYWTLRPTSRFPRLWQDRVPHQPEISFLDPLVQAHHAFRSPPAEMREETPVELIHPPIEDAAVVVFPGFFNYGPEDEWMDTLARHYALGGIILHVGPFGDIKRHPSYSIYGSHEAVVQPNWAHEVPLVLFRLAKALSDPNTRLANVKKLFLVGYSKGGFAAHGLKVLATIYDYEKNDGTFPPLAHALYPGLDLLRPALVKWVMPYLKDNRLHMYAPPAAGVPLTDIAKAMDKILCGESGPFYAEDFLGDRFACFGTELADRVILAERPETLFGELRQAQVLQGGPVRAAVVTATHAGFRYGVSPLLGAGGKKSDGVSRIPKELPPNFVILEKPDAHLNLVNFGKTALALQRIIHDREKERATGTPLRTSTPSRPNHFRPSAPQRWFPRLFKGRPTLSLLRRG